jgi:hypothetical protein
VASMMIFKVFKGIFLGFFTGAVTCVMGMAARFDTVLGLDPWGSSYAIGVGISAHPLPSHPGAPTQDDAIGHMDRGSRFDGHCQENSTIIQYD